MAETMHNGPLGPVSHASGAPGAGGTRGTSTRRWLRWARWMTDSRQRSGGQGHDAEDDDRKEMEFMDNVLFFRRTAR